MALLAQLSHHCTSDALKMAEFRDSNLESENCGAKPVRLFKRMSCQDAVVCCVVVVLSMALSLIPRQVSASTWVGGEPGSHLERSRRGVHPSDGLLLRVTKIGRLTSEHPGRFASDANLIPEAIKPVWGLNQKWHLTQLMELYFFRLGRKVGPGVIVL